MIIRPETRVIGRSTLTPKVKTDDNIIFIGGRSSGSTTPTPQPTPDLSDIDLTAETLDSRVSYSGPAHLYWGQSGNLETSAPNAWPLEYRNGVAIGRSLPEPQTTNFQENCRAIATSDNVKPSAGFTIQPDPTGAPDGGAISTLPVDSEFYLISQDINGVDLQPGTAYSLSSEWQRLAFALSTTANSRCRIWLGRDINSSDGTPFLFLTQNDPMVQGNYVFSWYARQRSDANEFSTGIGMIENGNYPYATSPVITEDANQLTRAASSVSVQVEGDAVSIAAIYSDGSIDVIPFNGADSLSLPFASYHWGERYLTLLQYLTEDVDLSPIDLTAETLDSRVTYNGPAHTYYDVNGFFLTSSENEWPLEYKNGVAVGRHEPEPAATNYATDSSAFSIGGPGSDSSWMYASGAQIGVVTSNFSSFTTLTGTTNMVFVSVYNETDASFLVADTDPNTGSEWSRVVETFTNESDSLLRWYTQRQSGGNYLYEKCPDVPAGDYVATVFRRLTADNMEATAPQIEPGSVPTSPIFNFIGEQNTRPASSVTVTNPGLASFVMVHYSDGSMIPLPFDGDTATIPLASQAWASRYITQITFNT